MRLLKKSRSLDLISVSALASAEKPRHRWYFFKEGFSPEIVTQAAEDSGCRKNDLIIDPFCGSGTVPLQAVIDGRCAASIEVNPFLAFVARAKLDQCKSSTLRARAASISKEAFKGLESPLVGFSTFSEREGLEKWLFNRDVLASFEGAWCANENLGVKTSSYRLAKLCLIGAAMDACNAVKDGKCLRYIPNWREKAFDSNHFVHAFKARIETVIEDLEKCPLVSSKGYVRQGDARHSLPVGRFRLCVTSPPYLNSFDYTDIYRPELFLGKWVSNMDSLRRLRLRTLRSHVQVHWPAPKKKDFGALFSECLDSITSRKDQLWNRRIPMMIQAYFEDMDKVLKNLRSIAARNASVWLVVSTSAYAGVEIPVDLIIADMASSCHWNLREVSVLRYLDRVPVQQWSQLSEKKKRGPHLRESLIILDAMARGKGNT